MISAMHFTILILILYLLFLILPLLFLDIHFSISSMPPFFTFLLWYNNDMNEKESRISKENRLIRKANYELDKENNELKKLIKDLEEENSRQDKVIRKMKEQLIQLMVENAELKRRN